jgi:hypothetical protein
MSKSFRKGRRTTDNIFIIRTIIEKYLAKKRGEVYWMFVDLEKAFNTVVRDALWWKLGRKDVSAKFIKAVRGMYSNAKISVKLEENRITQEFDSTKGLRQGCALSPALFNIYMNGILSKLDDANIRPPTMRNRKVPELLFADDLAFGTTTGIGMQRAINSIKEYCEECKLKINTNKTKIVFKKGGKLSKYENWKMGGEEIEVANEIK